MMTSGELDDIINSAENLDIDDQLLLIVHLAKKAQLTSTAGILLSTFMSMDGIARRGFVQEESFTGTWAYDQVWSSLRGYSMSQAGGREAYKFKQTGPKDFWPNGFEFGPKDGKPVFALVMRHYGVNGQEADQMIRSEINSFFEDGVQVVWEVDVDNGCAIHVYRTTDPNQATVYRMGEVADAEPALPGWRMAVSELPYHRDEGILSTNSLPNPNVAPADILGIPGKSEIVRGNHVHFSLAGGFSGWATDQIFSSLHDYARRTNAGIAVGDNKAFLVDHPGRKSFSPNVAFHTGEIRPGYYLGAPVFAVEVMNGLDYSNDGYGRISAKRNDYFDAGTQVVWNVDVLVNGAVWVYRKDNPDEPTVYHRGEVAEAEPALPGWTMSVDDLFYDSVGER